jgi:hypothetical protein
VAVRAQDTEVIEAVVGVVTVDVIKVQGQRPATPRRQPALGTSRFEQTRGEEPIAEM